MGLVSFVVEDGIIVYVVYIELRLGIVWSTPARLNLFDFKACRKFYRHLAP